MPSGYMQKLPSERMMSQSKLFVVMACGVEVIVVDSFSSAPYDLIA
jgi:hypothetical protein